MTSLGIDIYRYQTVIDPGAVRRADVEFAWVKGTDGGSSAIVRADRQVAQMNQARIPVGLYHYAQLSPSPEVQADVLTSEVRRTGAAGLPPALDLEDPHAPGSAAAEFARRFLRRMKANGFPRVALYANTSMLTGIRAEEIRRDLAREGITVIIWAAGYGKNDGYKHPLTYGGLVHVHQYTSKGRVAGISGDVDLNHSADLSWIGAVDDMPLDNEDLRKITDDTRVQVLNPDGSPIPGYKVSLAEIEGQNNRVLWILLNKLNAIATAVDAQADDESKILAAVAGLSTGNVDVAVLADALATELGTDLGNQFLDAMRARLTE